MKWNVPPRIKVHEALGCIGDMRIEVNNNGAKVYSSSKGKFYVVKYDPMNNAIMANDNGSYWKGYLGYPSIAFLMIKGIISFNSKLAEALKDIKWKDLNTKFKNDFAATEGYVNEVVKERGFSIGELNEEIDKIYTQVKNLNLVMFGDKIVPPKGY